MHIDFWTLGLQSANVLILVWLLQRFLFRPVTEAVARRQKLIAQRLDEAVGARNAANELKGQLETEKLALATARETLLADTRSAAQNEKAAMLKKAGDEAASLLQSAQTELAKERQSVMAGVTADAGALAVQIAGRLLGSLPAEFLISAFIDDSVRVIAALPIEQRQIINEDLRDGGVWITTTILDAAAEQACRQKIEAALGRPADFRFTVDPSLIAGIELKFRRLVIRNSWAHDLYRLQQDLAEDGQPRSD